MKTSGDQLRRVAVSSAVSALMVVGSAAQADVDVRFVKPESYADVRDELLGNEHVLQGLEQHLRAQGSKVAGDSQRLQIDVLDVDLAGQMLPWMSRGGMWVRVLKSSSPPALQLRYTLSDAAGKVIKQGETRILDLSYQYHLNRYSRDDPQRYEKAMLDRWFADEFGLSATALIAGKT